MGSFVTPKDLRALVSAVTTFALGAIAIIAGAFVIGAALGMVWRGFTWAIGVA